MMKTCPKCHLEKDVGEFNRCARSSDGLQSWCRLCGNAKNREAAQKRRSTAEGLAKHNAATCQANKKARSTEEGRAKAAEANRKYSATERGRAVHKAAAAKQRARQKAARALLPKPMKPPKPVKPPQPPSWKVGNRAWERYVEALKRMRRGGEQPWYTALVQATPAWLTPEMWLTMGAIYEQSYLGAKELVIDHVVPLVGKDAEGNHVVCGLHVPWNLQVLTASENSLKGCQYEVSV